MKKYKVLRYNLKYKMGDRSMTDGAKALETLLNELAEEGYEFLTAVESIDDLQINHALVLEKEV